MNPPFVTFTYFKRRPIRIWQVEVLSGKTELRAGSLIQLDKNKLDIATGDGILGLYQLQLPGKRIQSARDFINGYRKELIPGKTIWG